MGYRYDAAVVVDGPNDGGIDIRLWRRGVPLLTITLTPDLTLTLTLTLNLTLTQALTQALTLALTQALTRRGVLSLVQCKCKGRRYKVSAEEVRRFAANPNPNLNPNLTLTLTL